MSYLKSSLLLVSILLVAVGVAFVLGWLYVSQFTSYADMQTALTITTETFGVLLGIITAGLMFTQGKFSELSSELSEKAPHYIADVLSLEKIQLIEAHLLDLRKTFGELAASATVVEERNLYERIVEKASSMFVSFAVLLNLKLKQQGLPETGFLVSEMDSKLYEVYEKGRRGIKKEWHLFNIIEKAVDMWEVPASFSVGESHGESTLCADLNSSMSILKLKERIDRSSADIRVKVEKALGDLNSQIGKISRQLHEDRIRQLLSQMEQASIIRGKYFYLTLIFIAAPLLINLLILPQLSETTAVFFRHAVSVTSLLSVAGVVFLLLYVHKILNV